MKKPREYACVLAPALPLQALVRSEPDLVRQAVGTVEGEGTRAVVHHLSRAALAAGVRAGMTPSQARSVAPGVVLRTVPPAVIAAARQAMVDVAFAHSPRVQPVDDGAVVLDVTGTDRLYPSRPALGCVLQAACGKVGLRARVAVASGHRIALIAARSGEGVVVVTRGAEAAALAPLPLKALDPSPPLFATLARLGLRTIGDFARLDKRGLGIRLGPEAMDLHRLAGGEDAAPLAPLAPSEVFEESVSMDYVLDNTEPLAFLLAAAIERLAARLAARLMAPAGLTLSLDLDPEGLHALSLTLPAPSADVKSLLTLLRHSLDGRPPPAPVRGFTLSATGSPPTVAQGHLFGPPLPEPSRVSTLLARLSAMAGLGRVGAPAVVDGAGRDVSAMAPFDPAAGQGPAASSRPLVLAFRRFDPPVEVAVDARDGIPVRVRGADLFGRVLHVAGPWYADAGWWTGRDQAGAFYDAEVAGVGILRLWRDLATERWWVDGAYD